MRVKLNRRQMLVRLAALGVLLLAPHRPDHQPPGQNKPTNTTTTTIQSSYDFGWWDWS